MWRGQQLSQLERNSTVKEKRTHVLTWVLQAEVPLNLILDHIPRDALIPALTLMPKQAFSKQSVFPISAFLPVEEVN